MLLFQARKDVNIEVKNHNEPPTVVTVDNRVAFSIAENLPPGHVLGMINILDPEPPGTVSFKLHMYQELFDFRNIHCTLLVFSNIFTC